MQRSIERARGGSAQRPEHRARKNVSFLRRTTSARDDPIAGKAGRASSPAPVALAFARACRDASIRAISVAASWLRTVPSSVMRSVRSLLASVDDEHHTSRYRSCRCGPGRSASS
jgi:hypothetical protein